jgi:hypothetical protein
MERNRNIGGGDPILIRQRKMALQNRNQLLFCRCERRKEVEHPQQYSQSETIANRVSNSSKRFAGNFSGGLVGKSRRIQRANLEAKKNRFHRQATFRRGDAHVGRIIAADVFPFCSDDDGNNQRQLVDGVHGQNQDGTLTRLFASANGIEIYKKKTSPRWMAIRFCQGRRLPRLRILD